MNFTHLHLHTDYSILDGQGKISNYIQEAKKLGFKSLAITDHGVLFGAMEFYKGCLKEGIKPIIGCEVYITGSCSLEEKVDLKDRYHLILLCKNEKGYRNLLKLVSIGWIKGFYGRPRIDHKTLKEYSEGLICLSACMAGEISRYCSGLNYNKAKETAKWYKNLFGDDYYLEIQNHGIREEDEARPQIIKLAKELNIKVVATADCHYVKKEDSLAHRVLVCLGRGQKLEESYRSVYWPYPEGEFYLKSAEEMASLFPQIPEAVSNTQEVADKCSLEISFPGPLLPNYQVPKEFKSQGEFLRHIAIEGLKKRYGKNPPKEYIERLNYELDVIIKMHFEGYFLIVYDYVHWSKTHDVPVGPGRGSGAGSIVAYSIEITDIDPMKYGLLFERFLNPERISMPDFDIDFCTEKREKVIEYVTQKYGSDNVGQICTFGTMGVKNCIKDVGRILEIPLFETDKMCKDIVDDMDLTFDWLFYGHTKKDGTIYPKNNTIIEFYKRGDGFQYKDKKLNYKTMFDIARKLEGTIKNTGLHAAGVVIGQTELSNYVPIYQDPKTQKPATQFPMTQIEDCGLVKMDFLGLKTLTLIANTIGEIKKTNPNFDINKIPEDDKKTFELFASGDTQNIFQFESEGMRKWMKSLEPESISELAALNALYRPGPMDNIPQYVENKKNIKGIKYPHPDLKEILKETYGVIVYQEQVMKVAQVFAGYSLGQADILRKIMGKKKKELLPPEKEKFVSSSLKKGHSKKEAEGLFQLLEPFAGYGFNKSHAVGYAFLAYQTAYLKANYPAEFMVGSLSVENDKDKYNATLARAKQMNIEVCPPDINYSSFNFAVRDGKIFYGLSGIANVGSGASEVIIAEREKNGPYKSIDDFMLRLDSKTTNARVLKGLISSGALDLFNIPRQTMEENLDSLIKWTQKERDKKDDGCISLFSDAELEICKENFVFVTPKEKEAKIKTLFKEYEALGCFLSGNPLDEYSELIQKIGSIDFSEAFDTKESKQYILLLSIITVSFTKKGEEMAKLTLSSYNCMREVICWPNVWSEIKGRISENMVIWAQIEPSRDSSSLLLLDAQSAQKYAQYYFNELNIALNIKDDDDNIEFKAQQICSIIADSNKEINGEIDVFVKFSTGDKIKLKERAVYSKDLLENLRQLSYVDEANYND